jgi:membrane protein YqaA with SNARE-associated domain
VTGSQAPKLSKVAITRIVALLLAVAITFLVYAIRDQVEILQRYGYPGIFLLSILANATVILPAPGIALTFSLGGLLNPVGVALAAGAGAAIGELTGYMAGYGSKGVFDDNDIYERLKGYMERYGAITIVVVAFIPNPFFDLAGAAAGALEIPVTRFLLWAWIGKTLKMLVIAFAGAVSIDWVNELLSSP